MQDQQRASLLNNPHFWDSSHPSSVYATPNNNMYNNPGQCQHLAYPAYYVDSPSTVALDINSDNFGYEEDQRTSERLSEPFSASLLSRSTSFLSNCTSERVSIPDVSARRQSWCKSIQESMATNKWETCDEEMSLEAKGERTRLRWLDILKSLISWLCITVLLVGFLMALFTSMYWLICHPQAPSTTFKGVEFQSFNVMQGYDRTGVPTDMVNLDATVKLSVNNPSKYYGAFVSAPAVHLSYLPRSIAHSQVPGFYQGCNSERDIIIKANAEYEPLYGAGPSLQQAMLENRHIPLGLIISLKSHVNVFGNIVLKYFIQTHVCNVMLNPNTGTVTATYCEPPRKQEGYDISRFKRHSP
ncbi:uncharacterized protein [Physcomitrium patens]|nr:uncharacterized protein LOC112293329 isoform X2 [Physcomitrium patens]|eukprot:XP_024398380.1 uncharacterized protein LOC112293329 isoform X2 [Physcomitrella patens]